jgi:hypothetical protein
LKNVAERIFSGEEPCASVSFASFKEVVADV